jgi:hypothetical protein
LSCIALVFSILASCGGSLTTRRCRLYASGFLLRHLADRRGLEYMRALQVHNHGLCIRECIRVLCDGGVWAVGTALQHMGAAVTDTGSVVFGKRVLRKLTPLILWM